MREVITIHVGQAGVQLGSTCWNLFRLEHNLDPAGILKTHDSQILYDALPMEEEANQCTFSTFFKEQPDGRYTPRALMVDLEPSAIDAVRTGLSRRLFPKDHLISGIDDASNNFARGYYTAGRKCIQKVVDVLRKLSEECDCLQGFLISHSLGGGTGSGLGALITRHVTQMHMKKTELEITIYPNAKSSMTTSVVEPINSVLGSHMTMDYADCSFMADNESLANICRDKLEIEHPNFNNMNGLLAQAVSSVTASLRSTGAIHVDLADFQTNLVPYPRLHFPLMSYAPVVSKYSTRRNMTTRDVTFASFEPDNQLLGCDVDNGKYMACCLIYRGDITPTDINSSVSAVKASKCLNFVDWCPTGFKVGLNMNAPMFCPGSDLCRMQKDVCLLTNNTAMREAWDRLTTSYDLMYAKGAFIHWYLNEGMDISEFEEAREDLTSLQEDYMEIQKGTKRFPGYLMDNDDGGWNYSWGE